MSESGPDNFHTNCHPEFMMNYFWIGLGGGLGSLARHAANVLLAAKWGDSFPAGTLCVNVLGSLAIGCLAALTQTTERFTPETRSMVFHFLMVGLCGGFTTFSAFSLQTLQLIRNGNLGVAFANVLLSVSLCVAATWLGFALCSGANSRPGP
jgi:CrcB protein